MEMILNFEEVLMIEKMSEDDYRLICDYCGDECVEVFDSFQEAVEYKKNRANRWTSIKDKSDVWTELCPSCNTPYNREKIQGKKQDALDERKLIEEESERLKGLVSHLDLEDFQGGIY